jgi:putative ABC transport system permease protein
MMTDLRNAVRALRAAPRFTGVALLILTLGIGASTAIFSVVDAVVIRGLPFDDADRLVSVSQGVLSPRQGPGAQAPQNYLDWRAGQQVFDGLAAIAGSGNAGYVLRSSGEGKSIRTQRVTHELFPVLRVAPFVGRTFSAEHEVDGRERVAVLSYAFWRQQFGGDPGVVGQTMTLDNGTYDILGVMPAGFSYPTGLAEPPEMWVPYVVPATERTRGANRGYYLQLIGRLKAGVSYDQARAQLEGITTRLAEQSPTWFTNGRMSVVPLRDALVGPVRSWMLLLLGVVTFVLLLASMNVANLMLARAIARERELGIRAALGASRWQLARGLLVESLVLSLFGASLGLCVAWAGVEFLRSTMPANVPRVSNIGIDLRVLAVSAGVAIGTGLLFGLLPAFRSSRPDVNQALREGGRSATAGVSRQRLRSVLVTGEVALATVLLVGTGLFVSSFAHVTAIDLGIDREHVVSLSLPLGTQRVYELSDANRKALADRNRQRFDAVLESLRGIPGLEQAAIFSGAPPLTGSSNTTDVKVLSTGQQFRGRDSPEIKRITPEYHSALRIPLRAGRFFTPQDRRESAPVVILSDVASSRYFESRSTLGQILIVNGEERTVVGVVGAVRQNGPEARPAPEVYVPLSQTDAYNGDLVIRTNGDPAAVLPSVRRGILNVLPNAVFPPIRTMDERLDMLIAQRRLNMLLFSMFGALGLAIALVGIYGVMGYVVEQRTAEFGVRIALGAPRGRVVRMVLGQAGAFVAVGLATGLGASIGLSRLAATFLFEVRPTDPLVYAAVTVPLALAGALAALVPAWRASRVDPMIALRTQ